MIRPTIHLNGTSAEALKEVALAAYTALNLAEDALWKMSPHGRDYYPQGEDTIVHARAEHIARCDAIRKVIREIEEYILTLPA